MTQKVSLQVRGVDLEDEAVLERVATHLDDLLWSQTDDRVCVDIFADKSDLVCAVVDVACRIRTHLLDARIDQVDDELVGIPDIAARIGLNRETIRSWANGTRGPGDFPISVGSLGGGQRGSAKIWRWRDVNKWLKNNLSLGDNFDYPSQAQVADINSHLMRLESFRRPSVQNGPMPMLTLDVSNPIRSSSRPIVVVTSQDPRRSTVGNSVSDSQNVVIGSKS
jgi:hypothetical protein